MHFCVNSAFTVVVTLSLLVTSGQYRKEIALELIYDIILKYLATEAHYWFGMHSASVEVELFMTVNKSLIYSVGFK